MYPNNGRKLPKETDSSLKARLKLIIRTYSPVTWLVLLIASLVVFLVWMPTQMRGIIWDALAARGIISSMLLAFSLLAVSLIWSIGQQMDDWAFLFFNLRGKRPIWLDRSMLVITQIGSGIFAMVVGLVLFFTGNRLIAYILIFGTITLWILVELIKALVRRPRPFIRVTQARTVGRQARGRSFPSGHTSQIFFMATLMAKYFHVSAWIVFLLYAIALVVGVTRMYVGAHYPRDVMAGAILGSAWGLLGILANDFNLNATD